MRGPVVWLAAALGTPAVAAAAPVIGGSDAPAGMWPEVASVRFPEGSGSDQPECTGTLIAPTVVLTAGHCATLAEPPLPDTVLVGTNALDHPERGEVRHVGSAIEYPDSQATYDLGVLVLTAPSTFAPRALATGWARLAVRNGASIKLVGYGATDASGRRTVPALQEAASTITDFDCTTSSGCHATARPDGELGAGGMGIDTCPGDSGGPLYVTTSFGTFLAGVTSRAYDGAAQACGGGGIYVRPEKVIAWMEQVAGVRVTHGPEPTLDAALVVGADGADGAEGAEATVVAGDPLATEHVFAIAAPPAHGAAVVRADGRLRVCSDGGGAGVDAVTVTVTDAADATRAVDQVFAIAVAAPAGGDCDPTAFADGLGAGDGGGCCDAGAGAAGSIPLALGVLAILRRRR